LHVGTPAMAQKNQETKPDIVFEFVRKLPVTKIAMSDNMESAKKEVKRSLWRHLSDRKHQTWYGD
jgi:hypothetical protein